MLFCISLSLVEFLADATAFRIADFFLPTCFPAEQANSTFFFLWFLYNLVCLMTPALPLTVHLDEL